MKIAPVNQMKLVAITMAFAVALCQYGALASDTNEGSLSNETIASIRLYDPSKAASQAGGKNLRSRRLVEWGDFRDDGCQHIEVEGRSVPVHRYASVLWGIPDRESWESTCAETPATVNGQYFPHPSGCAVASLTDSFQVMGPILSYAVAVYAVEFLALAEGLAYSNGIANTIATNLAFYGATTLIVQKPETWFDLNVWGVFYVVGDGC